MNDRTCFKHILVVSEQYLSLLQRVVPDSAQRVALMHH